MRIKKEIKRMTNSLLLQGYGWLKDKILSDEGRKQQSKLRELGVLASKFDCTLAQLAIGKFQNFFV